MLNLQKLPPLFLASVAIILGVVFVIIQNPPHDFCKSQIRSFHSSQKGSLSPLIKTCSEYNKPGACYEAFEYMRKKIQNFYIVDDSCKKKLFSDLNIKNFFFSSIELMVKIPWQEEHLSSDVSDKYSWLTQVDITLFCKLQRYYEAGYGLNSLKELQNQIALRLPNSQKTDLETVKEKSIFSTNCRSF